LQVVRVRHDQDRARVEVGGGEVPRLLEAWPELEPRLLALGFRAAVADPAGYRRGGADARLELAGSVPAAPVPAVRPA
jgi:PP-loop superfamily ATP-utilizing enzyme